MPTERPALAFPLRALLPAACILPLLLLAATCEEPRPTALSAGDVTVRMATRAEIARVAGGVAVTIGDFVIESGELRVIVGGLRRRGSKRGAILSARLGDMPADDSIVQLSTRLQVGGAALGIRPRELYVVTRGGRPALRILGEARRAERAVDVVQEISVVRSGGALAIVTRVAPRDDAPLSRLRVVSRIQWGGASPFVPGTGFLADDAWHDTHWVGRRGHAVATVFAYHDAPLRLRGELEQHGATSFLEHTDLLSPLREAGAEAPLVERSTLVLSTAGLAGAVRRLGWARGRPFPEVSIHLPYAPDGSEVRVHTAADRPLIHAAPDASGRLLLPLTPVAGGELSRSHRAVATAYGHAPSDEVRFSGRARERLRLVIPRGGRLRVVVTDAASGAPLAARLRFRGASGTAHPELGPDSRAAGAVDAVIAMRGEAQVPLAPGRYRVIVTRGPEWTLHDETVEVTESFRPDVRAALAHVVEPGEWVASDFHLHAAPSPDSEVTLEDRVASLVAEGIRFAVPTDHNHVTDYEPAIRALRLRDLGTVSGVEVTTWEPGFGHFNAYPAPLDPAALGAGAPVATGVSPAELFAAVHALDEDALVQVNHPRMEHDIGYFDLMGLDSVTGTAGDGFSDDFDVLEVWNGFDLARPEVFERVFADWLGFLARGKRLVAVGSSDSHRVHRQWAGYPRTYVRVPGGSVRDGRQVVRALRAGHAFVTSGPFLEIEAGGSLPGDTFRTRGPVPLRVRVSAPPWMDVSRVDVLVGGVVARTITISPPAAPPAPRRGVPAPPPSRPVVRLEEVITLDVLPPTFVLVVARGDAFLDDLLGRARIPPLAFTNPIWIEGAPSAPSDGGAAGAGAAAVPGEAPPPPAAGLGRGPQYSGPGVRAQPQSRRPDGKARD